MFNKEFKSLLIRGRNIIHYRLIDDRSRCQYIHVMRKFRKDLLNLRSKYPVERSIVDEILSLIPAKIKSEECLDVILKLKLYYDKQYPEEAKKIRKTL